MKIAAQLKKKFIDYSDDYAEEILANPDDFFVFVDLRLTECEPSDLCGIPRDRESNVKFLPLTWARYPQMGTRGLNQAAGMLLLDERE